MFAPSSWQVLKNNLSLLFCVGSKLSIMSCLCTDAESSMSAFAMHCTIEKFPNLWHSWHLHARRWHLLNSKCSCSHLSTDGDVGLVSQCVQEHCTRKHLHYCATKTTSQVKWNVVLLFTWLAIGICAHRRIRSACFTWGRTAKLLTSEMAHQCIQVCREAFVSLQPF